MILAGQAEGRRLKGAAAVRWNDWRWQLQARIRSVEGLAAVAELSAAECIDLERVTALYPCLITPYYLSLIDLKDRSDPLLRQSFPNEAELDDAYGGRPDPLGEAAAMPVPGLIRRYEDRCLVIATNDCAVYCRHCNRKALWLSSPYGGTKERLQAAADYVAGTPRIREVIVSGGDPLLLPAGLLDWFLGTLRAISHVEVLRIGSRAPVTLPMRITPALCKMLRRHRPLWLNTQFNHPREITDEAARACERLLEAGIPVSNQSVLLKGVNDDYETMRLLLTGLQRISVRPYYLFQCDPVRGTGHLRVEVERGLQIMERLWAELSGLCLPRYVADLPGSRGKVLLHGGATGAKLSFDKEGHLD